MNGALDLPVDVLRGDGDVGPGERLHGRVQRRERRADGDVDAVDPLELVAQVAAERRRLLRALVHLPVAGDQHPLDR